MSQKTYEELVAENEKLHEENLKLKNDILNQQLHINCLNRIIFGSKRESTPKENEQLVEGTQCSIFGEVEDEELKEEIEKNVEEITIYRKKKNKKRTAGIKKEKLKDIEKETRTVYLEGEQLNCSNCGAKLQKIGKKVVRQEIEYIPAKIKLVEYVSYSYKCTECEKNKGEGEETKILKTKTKNPLLPRSFVSPSLASEVIYQKYYMGAPLYRQEKMWDDIGLVLPRNMMANWCIKLSQYYFEPLYKLMLKQLKENCQVINMDETTIQCNKEPGRKASSNSYMWVMASGQNETKKGVIFYYSKSRSSEVANKLLDGYKNILVTDRI